MKTVKQLVDQALTEIETLSVEVANNLAAQGDIQLVDLRDIRELKREGKIDGAVHVPRGMLNSGLTLKAPITKLS